MSGRHLHCEASSDVPHGALDLSRAVWVEHQQQQYRKVPRHLHHSLVLSHFLEGDAVVNDRHSGQRLRFQTGDLMMGSPGSVVSGQFRAHYRTLVVPSNPNSGRALKPGVTHKIDDPEMIELFEAALEQLRLRQHGEWLEELVRRWSDTVVSEQGAWVSQLSGEQMALLEEARAFLESDLRTRTNLTQVAKMVGWHPHHLQRLFCRRYGLSPMQYQRQLRVETARRFIEDGGAACEVASELGFSDQSHFIRTYRHYYGTTPGNSTRSFYPDS